MFGRMLRSSLLPIGLCLIIILSHRISCGKDIESLPVRSSKNIIVNHSLLLFRGGSSSSSILSIIKSKIKMINEMVSSFKDAFKRNKYFCFGSPKDVNDRFNAAFGRFHTTLFEGTFKGASKAACQIGSFCCVYIAADGTKGFMDEIFCKSICDPSVKEFMERNFITFACSSSSKEGIFASRQLGVKTLPHLCVLRVLPKSYQIQVIGMHHCNPTPDPDELLKWMNRIVESNSYLLDEDRYFVDQLKKERTYENYRRKGYQAAIKKDKKDFQKKEKKEQKAMMEAAKVEMNKHRRAAKAVKLGAEPIGLTAAETIEIMLKLDDGSKVRRRFLTTDTVGNLFDWADICQVDIEKYELQSPVKVKGKKHSLKYPEDIDLNLLAAGLSNKSVLFVIKKGAKSLNE